MMSASFPTPAAGRTVLRVDSSPRMARSVTRRLADRLSHRLAGGDPARVVQRDLSLEPPGFVDAAWVDAAFADPAERTPKQRAVLEPSDRLVAELQAADDIVIAVPIYNFSIPAVLKAWIDQVARARVTFRYTEAGPEGLLTGKRAWILIASGGTEMGGPVDFATGWLRHVLGFLGIDDVRVIAADRLMAAPDRLAAAEAAIDAAADLAPAATAGSPASSPAAGDRRRAA